jgi:hypothetical protein
MRTQVISALIVFVPTVAFAACNPPPCAKGTGPCVQLSANPQKNYCSKGNLLVHPVDGDYIIEIKPEGLQQLQEKLQENLQEKK